MNERAPSPLLDSVRAAFTHGMDVSLAVAGVVALAGAIVAVLFRPARTTRPEAAAPVLAGEETAAESTV